MPNWVGNQARIIDRHEEAQLHLGGILIADGDGNLTHVVAEKAKLRALEITPIPHGVHPDGQYIFGDSGLPPLCG